MKPFLDKDFLLTNETARRLFHDYADGLPIIDYHCHLSPKDIVEDRHFANLTEAWLEGDHYKWRAMRTNGVDERYCTGSATPDEKFREWAATVPYTMRNPLYHWTHLELQRYFDIHQRLDIDSAGAIYATANEQLSGRGVRKLLDEMKVEVVSTTDDPVDSLEHHQSWQGQDQRMYLVPSFRADKVLFVEDVSVWNTYIDHLSSSSDIMIESFDDLLEALQNRHDFFDKVGCRLSDNGLNHIYADDFIMGEVRKTFQVLRSGRVVDELDADHYRSAVLYELAKMHHSKGWTQQYHLGALRNNSSRMLNTLGPDTGFDSIGDFAQAQALSRFMNRLDRTDQLARTVLYNLNPVYNEVFATMAGNFNDGSVAGKIQFGTAWWFMDQKEGMERQMNALSSMGLISRFVGMLTDSRSFLSFPRHEYFRRILCNLFGQDVENGELPNDIDWIGKLIQNISYDNARQYFGFYDK
ncbi:MAG: glucuronate isomerase [Bacteroidota bacterium]